MIGKDWLVVIPARLHSTRLTEKPLQDLAGKPLIQRVYEQLLPLSKLGAVLLVATDSEKIAERCRRENIPIQMTDAEHKSGTDRCAEVARLIPKPFILNVQGDEPFVSIDDLLALMNLMTSRQASMGTMKHRNLDESAYLNPNSVKLVTDEEDRALYFSRSPLPYYRPPSRFQGFWQHVGVYAFRQDTLQRFCLLPPHPLEQSESLEQLRALAHGIPILVSEAQFAPIGIDTPEDLEVARARFQSR